MSCSSFVRHSRKCHSRKTVSFSMKLWTLLIRNDPQGTWKYIQSGYPAKPSQSVEKTGIQADDGHSLRERAYMTDVVQELLLRVWAAWDPVAVFDRIDQIPRHLQAVASERAIEATWDHKSGICRRTRSVVEASWDKQ